MPKPHHSLNSSSSILSYSVPKLHTGKTWYVDFFCYDPVEQRMRRKKYHLDGIKKLSMRKQCAADLRAALSERLRRGWNVWAENAACDRHYSPYTEVCKFYCRYLDKMFSIGVLKKGSYLTLARWLRPSRWARHQLTQQRVLRRSRRKAHGAAEPRRQPLTEVERSTQEGGNIFHSCQIIISTTRRYKKSAK